MPERRSAKSGLPRRSAKREEQVGIERRLVESELRLASIIGTTMDAIVMCDEAQRIVLFNRSAEEMFGCAAADALQRPLGDFVPGLAIADVPPGGLRRRLEVEGRRDGRDPLPIEVSVSDVVVHGERLFTVIARDISERRPEPPPPSAVQVFDLHGFRPADRPPPAGPSSSALGRRGETARRPADRAMRPTFTGVDV